MEDAVDAYQRKLSVLKHQQGLLYRDYMDAKESWGKEKQAVEKKLQDFELLRVEAESRKGEFEVYGPFDRHWDHPPVLPHSSASWTRSAKAMTR